jgi:hypothetical protein
MKIQIPDGLTQKEIFRYLHKNKDEAVHLKRSEKKICDDVVITFEELQKALKEEGENKAVRYLHEDLPDAGVVKRTIVGNTYNWLDSHDDVHLNNLFAKSVAEKGTKVPLLHDHIFQLDAKVGTITSLAEKEIKWKELGVAKSGTTMSLIAEADIKKRLNELVYDAYLNNEIDQHSVAMVYVKMALAINDKDYTDEYKVWKAVIDLLGNKSKADAQGYFWAISEAKLIEISGVLMGSNELTPTLGNKMQPLKGTDTKEPVRTTLNIDKLMGSYNRGLSK